VGKLRETMRHGRHGTIERRELLVFEGEIWRHSRSSCLVAYCRRDDEEEVRGLTAA
jgi:hypothetical protein